MESINSKVQTLLTTLNASNRLKNHLKIVHKTAEDLLNEMENQWQNIQLDKEAILFGTATHDIGKTIIKEELYNKGKRHEQVGYDLLIKNGYSERLARFTKTHGNWQNEDAEVEDLIVSLADKIWKGKRVHGLEEKLCSKIAEQLDLDFWEILQNMDKILSKIALSADENLKQQRS